MPTPKKLAVGAICATLSCVFAVLIFLGILADIWLGSGAAKNFILFAVAGQMVNATVFLSIHFGFWRG